MSILQFDLSPLIGGRPGERLSFFLDEGPRWLDDIQVAFLRGPINFTRVQGGILVQANLQVQAQVECVRCLEPFPFPFEMEVEEVIGFAGKLRPGITYQLDEEGGFNPLPLLREQVWVSLPMKPICQPDCRGLCPECGANLNIEPCTCNREEIDPRLAMLARLKRH
jgi:uncharacterized protein